MIPKTFVKLLLLSCFAGFGPDTAAQKIVQETFFYNPKGMSFIPAMKKPSVIYQGRLYSGRRQLTGLFNHLNNEVLNYHFKKYKANKTAAALLTVAGVGLSAFTLIEWRDPDKSFNWYTFGAGLLLSGTSGYLDAKGNEHLRQAAIVFDNATRKATFVPAQSTIRFTIPLSR